MSRIAILVGLLAATGCGQVKDNDGKPPDAPVEIDAPSIDSPTQCPDADGDTVCDADDICAAGDDKVDADTDTVPDACDKCAGYDDKIDTDADGTPNGCDPERLLIVHGNATGPYLDCVKTGLMPYFTSITLSADTPSAAVLADVDTVLVYNNGDHTDEVTLGNALADFFDAHGHVVEGLYGTGQLSGMAGRWATDGYRLLDGNYATATVSLGTVAEPASPLMTGVATLGSSRTSAGVAINGGVAVASWSDGKPAVVRGTKNGHRRADIGFFPGGCNGGLWTGDGFVFMRNALKY